MTITVKFNNLIHEFLYMKLRESIVKPTFYLDFEALRHFNVHNEILEILFDFKLDTFTHISLLSHESLTFEFLISFSYDLNHQLVNFHLQNCDLIMTMIGVNDLFGFSQKGYTLTRLPTTLEPTY